MEMYTEGEMTEISIPSVEDEFALRALTLFECLNDFLSGKKKIAREIPVMGMPFDQNIVVLGIIDELRYDPDSHELTISEYKTRVKPCRPTGDLKLIHKLQVLLYKKIFDDLTRGQFDKFAMAKSLHLDADKELGSDLLEVIRSSGFNETRTFGSLCDLMTQICLRFKPVAKLEIEYHSQYDNQLLGVVEVKYDDIWLQNISLRLMLVWQEKRRAVGVDVRGAWKCKQCHYASRCSWQIKRKQRYCNNNKKLSSGKTGN